ncbi:ADP-ribosylation factor-like protein [Phanerochaete sordida]|uniref:ADP-ribosylation factor n=1 Tax=Phanerochaete sordida TaxID=48140 RepID=A0A9P3LID3_9APHY|nr:ADP-ribosylation factor-like protein [Phanerochaete sordida]
MGGTISQLLSGGQSRGMRIFLTGLEGSGKTTFLKKMKQGQPVAAIPELGFIEEGPFTVDLFDEPVIFTAWHAGGKSKDLPDWDNTSFQNPRAIIFLVDANDPDRLPQAREALRLLNAEEQLRDIPLLVLANKQDMPAAMSIAEVSNKLGDQGQRPWTLETASLIDGEGMDDGFQWLSPMVR